MRIIVFIFLFIASVAEARMYQWVDPDTQTTHLSGKPPAWYRSVEGGLRVLVFEKNMLIDDTAQPLSEAERQRLRDEAFKVVEEQEKSIESPKLEYESVELGDSDLQKSQIIKDDISQQR